MDKSTTAQRTNFRYPFQWNQSQKCGARIKVLGETRTKGVESLKMSSVVTALYSIKSYILVSFFFSNCRIIIFWRVQIPLDLSIDAFFGSRYANTTLFWTFLHFRCSTWIHHSTLTSRIVWSFNMPDADWRERQVQWSQWTLLFFLN